MTSNLAQRVAVSAIAIPLAVGLIRLGGWPLAAALAVLGVLGTREVYDLARRQGIAPLRLVGYAAATAIPLATFWARGSERQWAGPALYVGAVWLMLVLACAMARGPEARPLSTVAVTVFGALYASGLLSFLIVIRHGGSGAGGAGGAAGMTAAAAWPATWLVLLPLALTWIGDTCAMAAGTLLGGPKLAPVLSPRKTWAGAVGGTAGALVAALLIGRLILPRVGVHLGVWVLAAVGGVLAVAGQVGDVAESLLKREVGVKDSSALIPGHGGVLDRLDSLYFVIPSAAGLYKLFGIV
jgi:phosphatidate cytidylyltransferase